MRRSRLKASVRVIPLAVRRRWLLRPESGHATRDKCRQLRLPVGVCLREHLLEVCARGLERNAPPGGDLHQRETATEVGGDSCFSPCEAEQMTQAGDRNGREFRIGQKNKCKRGRRGKDTGWTQRCNRQR